MALVASFMTVGLGTAAWADFQSAFDAYRAKNYSKAFREFTPLAEQGDAVAQLYLGLMYEGAKGTAKDNVKAAKWHRRAAEQGIAQSQDSLGMMYATGAGVTKDPGEALRWFQKAANQGFAEAQFHLFLAYDRGLGAAPNQMEAVKWARKAAIQGHARAQYRLGLAYYRGDGIAADRHQAVAWLTKGAAQGHAFSQDALGQLYEAGTGVAQDYEKAAELYRKAAAQGVGIAAKRLDTLRAKSEQRRNRIASRPAIKPNVAPVNTSKVSIRPDDVAVVIGNGDYQKFGKDIPNVVPAHADADAFKKWLVNAKGLREGNIVFLKDATSAQIESVFGNERSHKGQLFNWTKPNISNVYVYYAGHGAPASDGGGAFLVPSDATASSIELTGYPLATLYENLKKIPAKSITLVLESCFSGASQGGYVINRTSGILVTPKIPRAPKNITIISAGKADQVASWEKDDSHSLFTKYFLLGMGGEADKSPHGNGDGKVAYAELGKYLDDTMTYYARRFYGRDQNAQIVMTGRSTERR